MTQFRPCIDIHDGKVKQIVGGSLHDQHHDRLVTNFVSDKDSAWYARLYHQNHLKGGHVILLGASPENQAAALSAVKAYPEGLQVGGGIHPDNAAMYLDAGANAVIVTSWLFSEGELDFAKVASISKIVGRDHLVVDLSCRRVKSHSSQGDEWRIATNRWQTITQTSITSSLLEQLSQYCTEFLVHAADVEGLQQGMDDELIAYLGLHCPIPVTYAGGARNIEDLERCALLSCNRVDLTIGSALDIFGGNGARFADCVAYNQRSSL